MELSSLQDIGAVTGSVGGLVGLVALFKVALNHRKFAALLERRRHTDTIAEWRGIAAALREDITLLKAQIEQLSQQSIEAIAATVECEKARLSDKLEFAQQLATAHTEIEVLMRDMDWLKKISLQAENVGAMHSTLITANSQGFILDAVNTQHLLHYREAELIGKDIAELMPADDPALVARHAKGFRQAAEGGPIRSGVVKGKALRADREQVNVVVALKVVDFKGARAIQAELFKLSN